MANSIPTYTKIPIPFANSGDKNSIPQNATGSNLASYSEGFPPITSQPITENGIPPERGDFNGLGFSTTNNISYLQQGGLYTFDTQLSSAIGGYAQGAILNYISNGKLYKLISLVNNNTYNFNDDSSYIGQYWDYAEDQSSGQNGTGIQIGTIYAYISKQPPEGAYLLNGQTITDCATLYPQFYSWLVENAGLNNIRTVTASQFNQEVTEYGICNGFVIGNDGNVRLPLWKGYQTPMGDSVPVVGNGLALGLTNGIYDDGAFSYSNTATGVRTYKGAGLAVGTDITSATTPNYNSDGLLGITTDPTKSGIIADTSGLYPDRWSWVIQVFNTATDLSEQESAQLASQMQMKAQKDLGNVEKVPQITVDNIMPDTMDYVVESYDNGTSGYRLWRSGYCEQWGDTTQAVSGYITVTFYKEFRDTNYIFLSGTSYKTNTTASMSIITADKTTIGCKFGQSSTDTFFGYWLVKGYAK